MNEPRPLIVLALLLLAPPASLRAAEASLAKPNSSSSLPLTWATDYGDTAYYVGNRAGSLAMYVPAQQETH